jgi:hypothetical protein
MCQLYFTREVFKEQGALFLTMVHGQAFRIIT